MVSDRNVQECQPCRHVPETVISFPEQPEYSCFWTGINYGFSGPTVSDQPRLLFRSEFSDLK